MLKHATLLALLLGTIGLMGETEVESGLLPIPIPIPVPAPIESSAVKVAEVVQVQDSVDTSGQTVHLEKKESQVEDAGSKRTEPPIEPQRNEEPRQPEAVPKPNLPANAPAPPKQVAESPKTKPSFKSGIKGKDEGAEEPSEKPQLKNKKGGKGKNDNDNENDNGQQQPNKTNYTVPKRRSQFQQNGAMEEAVPGSVIGALVLFLIVAMMQ